jgi:hypothetical protein
MDKKAQKVLAYTVSYGDRAEFLKELIPNMRGTAGLWFDWLVCLGNPSDALYEVASEALNHPEQRGIQYLQTWEENRGQHFATKEAFALAKAKGYNWVLRLDDDVKPKTKRWLKKMIDYTLHLSKAAKDTQVRVTSAPKILGLRNPLKPLGTLQLPGLSFDVDAMEFLGGACRLHPASFYEGYKPNIYAPVGRQDPQNITTYVLDNQGIMVRYPGIRMVHRTDEIEKKDSVEQSLIREMGYFWPYLGATEEANGTDTGKNCQDS